MANGRITLRTMLLAGTALTAQPLVAGELPTGASVVHGAVGIATPEAGRMAIRQSSQNAIVSWQGFSIGADSAVDIRQPSASSAILNRVTGATPSTIAGRLTANGQVYLVNPNGIAITNGGTVEAGAFVASTLDISNDDFLAGRSAFRGDGQSAGVSNQGTIEIGRGGYAALIGGQVENSGTISVPLGRIGLGAGELVTLDVSGDGFLSVAIPSDSAAADALVESSGRLSADGGRIEISAATARQAARHAINLSGVVEARTVSGRSGEIVLSGGPGGSVSVSGRVDASAPAAPAIAAVTPAARPQTGGAIDITGATVALAGADIDASGAAGGGTIRIGGDYQGGGDLPRAWWTSVDAATRISADALEAGDGGRVILWSDDRTGFAGEISARGGPDGGDGGFAEVSGKGLLGFTGRVDLSAPAGAAGTLLLDPFDILIAQTADDQNQNILETAECCPILYEPETAERGPGTSIIDPDDLMAALESADVLITNAATTAGTEEGDITVAAALEWSSGLTLSLNALDDIIINEAITISPGVEGSPGGLNLFAGDGILLNAPITAEPGLSGGASLTFVAPGSITGAGPVSALSGDVSISTATEGGGGGSIDIGAVAVGDGVLDLLADGGIAFESVSAPGGSVFLTAGGDIVTGTVSAAGGDLNFDAGGLLTVGGPVTAANGDLFLGGADIVLENSVSLPGGNLTVLANGTDGSDGTVTTTSEGTVSVGSFFLASGFPGTSRWVQNGADLPAFEATDFTISEGASFQRTVGGSGTDADPFLVSDVYGLQGIDSAGFDDQSFALASNIDASGTAGWNEGLGFNPIGEADFATTPFSGKLDGRGHTISGLFINRPGFSEGPSEPVGLFGLVLGEAEIRNLGLLGVNITGGDQTGALVGALSTSALVEDVFVSGGSVQGDDVVGGLVGHHFLTTPPSGSPAIFLTIRRAFADVAVAGGNMVGGLVGLNEGFIELAYSSGAVSGVADVGGLVGFNDGGTLNQTYAVGTVSGGPGADLTDGGLVGSSSLGQVTGSFWDVGATGQDDSRGGTGLTTAAFQNTQGFIALAEPLGWNFELDWAPPAPGFYPALYALEPVVRVVAGDDTATYGNPATFDPEATVFGGPGIFVFDEADDSLAPTITLSTPAFPDGAPGADVGTYPITPEVAGLTSADGITYRAVLGEGTLALDPATLTIVPGDVAKTYGDTYTFSDADFTVVGLTNEDEISVTLTSPGAAPNAPVAGNDYEIEVSEVAIAGADETDNLGNYVLGLDGEGFPTGLLTVEPRPLTIAANDLPKLLGSELVFAGTEFSAEGLAAGDSISTVSLTSEGAEADASLEGNPYPIFVGNPEGTGLFSDGVGNYDITFVSGELIVHSPLAEAGFDSRAAQFAPDIVLPDPVDQIAYGGGGGGGGPVIAYPGARTDLLAAVATLDTLERLSDDLEAAVEACHESQPNLESYLDCIGSALDQYAAQIDMIALDLPESLRGVSATIQQASRDIAEARDTAVRRLATARTDAERTQIRREAATQARAAIETATTEIRKSIALIRAEEPQVARVQAEQGDAITAALEMVGSDLERVVGL